MQEKFLLPFLKGIEGDFQEYGVSFQRLVKSPLPPLQKGRVVQFSARPERAMSYEPRVKPWERGHHEALRSEGAPH